MESTEEDSLCLTQPMMKKVSSDSLTIESSNEHYLIKLEPNISESCGDEDRENMPVASTIKGEGKMSLLDNEELEKTIERELGLEQQKSSLVCKFCNKTFSFVSRLKLHMRVHTGEKPFACSFCDFTASYKKSVEIHMRSHTGERPYACSICDFRAAQKASVDDHMRVHTGEKPFGCPLCNFRSAQQSNVRSHMKTHSLEKPFGCHICGFRTAYKQILDAHIRVHTGERPFPCDMCDYRGTTKHNVKLHKRSHTGEKPFSCTLCDFRSTKRFHVKLHMRRHTGEKPYSCSFCDYTASQKQCLKIHLRRHTGERPFSCHLCDFRAAHSKSIRVHMKLHTQKVLQCTQCELKFEHKEPMQEHLRIIHQFDDDTITDMFSYEKLFPEDYKKKLRKSKGSSTPEKVNLECPYCPFVASTKSSFREHKKTHKNKKRFECDLCRFSTVRKKTFTDHLQMHKNNKTKIFLCPYCNGRFLDKIVLENHISSNHDKLECGPLDEDKTSKSSHSDDLFDQVEPLLSDITPVIEELPESSSTDPSVFRKVVFKGHNGTIVVTKKVLLGKSISTLNH